MDRGRVVVVALLALLFFAACGSDEKGPNPPGQPPPVTLVINEFMARNVATLADEFNEFDDWLELWNRGPDTQSTGGLYLTDDYGIPNRWALPETTLAAGSHLIIWADGQPEQGTWHASFRLEVNGEEIALNQITAFGTVLVDSVTYGAQQADTSYARFPDGGAWMQDPTPTPVAANQ